MVRYEIVIIGGGPAGLAAAGGGGSPLGSGSQSCGSQKDCDPGEG